MEILIVGAIGIVSVIVVGFVSIRTQGFSQQGWGVAINSLHATVDLQASRINTLENRLQARSLEEFAYYQNIPSELDKTVNAQQNRSDQGYGQSRDERLYSEGNSQGEDLEGIDIGNTIG